MSLSNVLIYAHDQTAGYKKDVAARLVTRLLDERSGLLSIQVLTEFYVAATRNVPRPLPAELASEIIQDFGTWPVFSPRVNDVLQAIRMRENTESAFGTP